MRHTMLATVLISALAVYTAGAQSGTKVTLMDAKGQPVGTATIISGRQAGHFDRARRQRSRPRRTRDPSAPDRRSVKARRSSPPAPTSTRRTSSTACRTRKGRTPVTCPTSRWPADGTAKTTVTNANATMGSDTQLDFRERRHRARDSRQAG